MACVCVIYNASIVAVRALQVQPLRIITIVIIVIVELLHSLAQRWEFIYPRLYYTKESPNYFVIFSLNAFVIDLFYNSSNCIYCRGLRVCKE